MRVMINGARSRKIRLNPGFGGMSAVLGAGEGSQMEVEEARAYEPPASDAREVGTARGRWEPADCRDVRKGYRVGPAANLCFGKQSSEAGRPKA